jgi:hypothetical protein
LESSYQGDILNAFLGPCSRKRTADVLEEGLSLWVCANRFITIIHHSSSSFIIIKLL